MVSDYSFTSGISALKSHSRALAAIADNVANLNTGGFKHTEIHTNAMTSDYGGNSIYGNYSGASAIQHNRFGAEGTPISTQNPLDGAIMGKGYFITSNQLSGGETYLTAAGQFEVQLESDGSGASYMRDVAGNYLMGWDYDPTTESFGSGTSVSSLGPIRVDRQSTTYDAIATSQVQIGANLSSDTEIGESHTISFNMLDGSGDADGFDDAQEVNLIFTKVSENTWDVTFNANGGTVSTAPFQVEFDASGQQMTIVGSTSNIVPMDVSWTNSGVSNSFNLELTGFTQYSGQHTLNRIDTNGFTEGVLSTTYFGDDGIIYGNFTNGSTRPVAKIAIGDVVNPEKLQAVTGTHFKLTGESGDISVYDPETTTRARFVPGAYEGASTNLNTQFSNMITTQRAYSSAATTIRTADEMMQTATKLK